MFVCPEFGQHVLPGRPSTRKQDDAGINQQYTPSDEQQDGMRPDGLDRVSCCYYSLPRVCLGCSVPTNPAVASCCCHCCLLLLLAASCYRRRRRRWPVINADSLLHSLNLHATRPHFQASWHSSPAGHPAGHPAQPAHHLTSWSCLAGTSPVTRHPSQSTILCYVAERGGQRLACRGWRLPPPVPLKTDTYRMTDEAAITPASANFDSATIEKRTEKGILRDRLLY